ncbi:MAG TPA: hypothetical protein VH415_06310 [Nitrososphaeraceae archaeon]|jgi:hypothetical protein
MLKTRYAKIAIFAIAATLLSTTAMVVSPSGMAFAQGNMSSMNATGSMQGTPSNMSMAAPETMQSMMNATGATGAGANVTGLTVVMDVDTFKNLLKQNHPLLAQIQEDEDRELIAKIKAQEVKQALKNEIALNILRLLAQYKAIDQAP